MLLVLAIVITLIIVAVLASAALSDSAPGTPQLPPPAAPRELSSDARQELPLAEEFDEDYYEADDYVPVEEAMFSPARHDRAFEAFFEPAGPFTAVGTNEADENSVCYVYGQTRRDCQCDECKQWRRARGI